MPIAKADFNRLPRNLRTLAKLDALNAMYGRIWAGVVPAGGATRVFTDGEMEALAGPGGGELLKVLRGASVLRAAPGGGWTLVLGRG